MAPLTEASPLGPRDAIEALITSEPVSVSEKLTLRSLAAVIKEIGIGAAVVHRDSSLVGIVSERDVVRSLADDADPDVVWSADIMTEDLVVADASETIVQVALRMLDESIRHVVVERNGQVIGVVSSRDVFRVLASDALDAQ